MRSERVADIAIVGAGIAGLAHAYIALKKGYRVVLFERDQFAVGASVRNFGLVWPIGQEPGVGLELALRSREHWLEVSKEAGFWLNTNGSMHVVYHEDEVAVLEEFMAMYKDAPFQCELLSPQQVWAKSPVVKTDKLKAGLWSATESTVYSREALRRIPEWLVKRYGLILKYGHTVVEVSPPHIVTARETWHVDKVFICSGADFETLYPEVYDQQPLTKCKLQMMKAVSDRPIKIGPSLCAGLTLRHYSAFAKCKSLKEVDLRYDREAMTFKEHGIHVLLAQNHLGELIIGDSHHYSRTIQPFDREDVNKIILDYLASFADLGNLTITERWHGVYPKFQGNNISLVLEPEPHVTIINGLGGAGMTLSFGLAERVMSRF